MRKNALCKLNKNHKYCYLWWICLSLLIAVADQITKNIIICCVDFALPVTVTSFFNLVVSFNRGAAFSLLNNASGWQNWLFGIIAALISVFIINLLYRTKGTRLWLSASLSLVLGGALGNLCDRLLHGYVVDFLDFHLNIWHWPAFNLADSAIVIGILMFSVS